MAEETLTVAEVLAQVDRALAAHLPGPVWVRGEVTGLRRTSGGAVFLRLADPDTDGQALDVFARGRIINQVDRVLTDTGMGSLRPGIEVRVQGTIGISHRQSGLRLSLLQVDPEFTVGRLAIDRARVLQALAADGSLHANKALPIPMVPLRVGLVTSRGSAAHGDFLDQLRRSGYRFAVRTAHTTVQGEDAPESLAAALGRVGREDVDVVALVRGGGARLDLAAFDSEVVGRAISSMPVPVVTGIGHEVDRTVADEAAAVSLKTPSAAGEWLVARVTDFGKRIDTAHTLIKEEARTAQRRARRRLEAGVESLVGVRGTLRSQHLALGHLASGIASRSRQVVCDHRQILSSLDEWFSTVGVDATLKRGFALVARREEGEVVSSARALSPGESLVLRFADGTVGVKVEEV